MKHIRYTFFQICIKIRSTKLRQIIRHSTYIFGNRHMIIIQNNNHFPLQHASVVKRFKSLPARQGAVSPQTSAVIRQDALRAW